MKNGKYIISDELSLSFFEKLNFSVSVGSSILTFTDKCLLNKSLLFQHKMNLC